MTYEGVRQLAMEHRCCFRCFSSGHVISNCDVKVRCARCGQNHVTAMHPTKGELKKPTFAHRGGWRDSREPPSNVNLCTSVRPSKGNFRIFSKTLLVEVRIVGTDRSTRCYCILDEQSNTSLVDPSLVSFFDMSPPETYYSITTVGIKSDVRGHVVSGLEIRGVGENEWISLPDLLTSEYIPNTKFEIATREMVGRQPEVSRLSSNFPEEVEDYDVLLLVGSNCGPAMATKPYGKCAPFAHHTALGWSLVGPAVCGGVSVHGTSNVVLRSTVLQSTYHADIKFDDRIPDFSSCGVLDDEMLGWSKNEKKFNDIMQGSIGVTEAGNLQMELPLVDDSSFPENKSQVFGRTSNTLRRLMRDPKKLGQCLTVMRDYLSAGHVRCVPSEDHIPSPEKLWYLPVFPVFKNDKCRIVFDGSASYGGVSLNDKLLQGPDNNNLLLGVLMRFRMDEIGFSCDIKSMFHCFYVEPNHRDLLRFLWFRNNDPTREIVPFQANVHVFGNTSSPAVANFGLRYAASHSPVEVPASSRDFIHKCMYVDDGLSSAKSTGEAIRILKGAQELLSHYNIKLHKIAASSPEVVSAFQAEDVACNTKIICADSSGTASTLGVLWNLSEDSIALRNVTTEKPFTKRGILSANGVNFDPMGVSAPVTLGGRLFQRMILPPKSASSNEWSKYDWDDPLPPKYLVRWKSWVVSLSRLDKITIPRGYVPLGFGKVIKRIVHVFCDASEFAIAYVIYLQSFGQQGKVHNAFVVGNSKVTPKLANSIPRLELCAAVEGTVAARRTSVELEIPMADFKFYSDSKVVLGYLRNMNKRFKRYVTTRVETILSCTKISQWEYISTTLNPADIGTKPLTPEELAETVWLRGPNFLWSCEEVASLSPEPPTDVELPEVLQSKTVLTSLVASRDSLTSDICKKTNDWTRAISRMQFLMRILSILDSTRARLGIRLAARRPFPTREAAISRLVSGAQREAFADIWQFLVDGHPLPENHPLLKYSPFMDETGLLRVGGRLNRGDIPRHIKNPVILPKQHPVSTMIVHNVHHRTMHSGRHVTLGAVRESGYFVLGGVSIIRSLLRDCFLCRVLRAPLMEQYMSDLPVDRLQKTSPFSCVGLDVFGPYIMSHGRKTRNNCPTKKLWGLLVTCLYSRAVHIEPLFSMDTSSFRNALSRFWAVRGSCVRIRSDRGTNFIGGSNQMEDEGSVDINKLEKFAETRGITWEFTTPGASSHGGVWERKVGAIKSVMSSTLRQLNSKLLSMDELLTLFQEACSIVNNTPLWSVSSDPSQPFPLSPSDLLASKKNLGQPAPERFSQADLLQYGPKRWRRVQYLAEQFWSRWRTNYLNGLQTRSKWRKVKRNVQVGDVVLLREKGCKRNFWPVGIVTSVKRSSDNLVRTATVTLSGTKKRVLERPIFDMVLLIPSEGD